jgi:mono/diheme cytochrome c family protein
MAHGGRARRKRKEDVVVRTVCKRLRWSGRSTRWVGLALGLAVWTASRPVLAADQVTMSPETIKEAVAIYQSRCQMCHGPKGKGDGPVGATLNPKARDLGDPAWQKSVTDEHIEKIILEGGAAVGKSPLMPANPDLKDKPEMVKVLRIMVRSFDTDK